MKTRFNYSKVLASLTVVLATAMAQAAAAQVTASLEPASIALGESAQLTVTISGSQNAQPTLPTVSCLEFTPVGQSSSYQSINGAVTANVSLIYQVTPDRPGTFTIPAIRVAGGGSSRPLALQVLKRTGNSAASPRSRLPSPNVPSRQDETAVNAKGEMAFLRVVLPKQELYVGELVPVQVKAYFRSEMSASLNGLPTLSSDAFTLNKLDDKPAQTQEVIGGRPYTVLTWSSALAAVKAGDYPLDLEMPVLVRVQQRGRRGGNPFQQFFGNSGFDDSFFDDFFGSVTEKPLTLRTDSGNVKILPLPFAGRPADFNGAVGQFEVTSEATPVKVTAGDPITLRLKVSGQGNFDRVTLHGLEASDDWKTYQPSVRFDPADNANFEGAKTFEQAIVPLKAGLESIPAIKFSYFDTEQRQYVTRATPPIAIQVAPGSGVPSVAALPVTPSTTTPTQSPASNLPASELAPNKVEAGSFVSSLQPILFRPWFIAAQGVPVMALLIGFAVHRRQERLAHDPQQTRNRAAQAHVREQLAAMDQALAANSAPAFFTAARQAVQEKLAQRWQLPTSQVTLTEINRRLNGDGEDVRTLFKVTDDVVYSGQRMPPAELGRWKDVVLHQLKRLEEI